MNNNINRSIKELSIFCLDFIKKNFVDCSGEFCDSNIDRNPIIDRLNSVRPLNSIKISEEALSVCNENNVLAYDYFILTSEQLTKKYGSFFFPKGRKINDISSINCYLIGDLNISNEAMLDEMIEAFKKDNRITENDIRVILNKQSLDLITVEEKKLIIDSGLDESRSKESRDECCSKKIEFIDLWLTPIDVIDKFFNLANIDRKKCMDPCASDGRWLNGEGFSIDILPMNKKVIKKDFLTISKDEIPQDINIIVGNLPFCLLDEFVNKSLELVDDCYFLVNGDTILQHFPDNIEHIYIFSGIEGKQKDNRSRCEFDVPFLIKSALWCCIVHITKNKQKRWVVEKNLSNEIRRDGQHVALGKNVFIKSSVNVDQDPRISRINVESSIIWKGGKKIMVNGELIDLKNFTNI